jgi:hypothetical protein
MNLESARLKQKHIPTGLHHMLMCKPLQNYRLAALFGSKYKLHLAKKRVERLNN